MSRITSFTPRFGMAMSPKAWDLIQPTKDRIAERRRRQEWESIMASSVSFEEIRRRRIQKMRDDLDGSLKWAPSERFDDKYIMGILNEMFSYTILPENVGPNMRSYWDEDRGFHFARTSIEKWCTSDDYLKVFALLVREKRINQTNLEAFLKLGQKLEVPMTYSTRVPETVLRVFRMSTPPIDTLKIIDILLESKTELPDDLIHAWFAEPPREW